MFKRLSALIWLRTQIFITNKNILIPVLMPYFMVLLLKFVMNTDSSKGLDLMSLCFSMAIGMAVGSPISAMIAEEKEKNNLTTLLLNGVRPVEYVISVLFYPVLISMANLILFPLITETNLSGIWGSYSIIMIMTSVASILINFLVGTISQTQSKAQIFSMIVTMVISLGPSLAIVNETVGKILEYSFIGAYIEFYRNPYFDIFSKSTYYLLAWCSVVSLLLVLSLKTTKKSFSNSIIKKISLVFLS